MSAESPRRSQRSMGSSVKPQPVSDKSVMESVVDFIQDVAYSHNTVKTDDKDKILWARFETSGAYDGASTDNIQPLLLVLGYSNGAQVWSITASGDAQEVMSLRQGPIRILRFLPHPVDVFGRNDIYSSKRPLVAVCDSSSAGQPFCAVKFVSLRSGDEVKCISFNDRPVTDIKCNNRLVVVAFKERIAAFDSCQFRERFTLTSCYPAPGINPNPIALGTRWLAYADKKLVPVHQSCGGMTGDGSQSYAATVISAAKTISKGLSYFGETVASSLTGSKTPAPPSKKETVVLDSNGWRPGVVTVVDTQAVQEGLVSVEDHTEGQGLIAHFPAHATEPVTALSFDPTGVMLLTVDRLGHNFHLFRIMVHPTSCSLGAVHHLYTLHRGDTPAKVQDISFSRDSRWVAVTTLRATTHIFPITPYGGAVNMRTHSSGQVVNRASRFHRSAGLEDMNTRRGGGDNMSGSPNSSPGRHQEHCHNVLHHNVLNNNIHNPRLPPYPHPTTVSPLAQIKHSMSLPGLGAPGATSKSGGGQGQGVKVTTDAVCVAACFAPSRGWVAGSPNISRDRSEEKKAVDSVFVVDWTGELVEHVLEPRLKSGVDKATDDSPLEVAHSARVHWPLARSLTSSELRPPLSTNNSLLAETELSQHSTEMSGGYQGQGWLGQGRRDSGSPDQGDTEDNSDQWLAQVEMHTHSGPHRRLWMGPQFSFKTYAGSSLTVLSSNSSVLHSTEPHFTSLDLLTDDLDLHNLRMNPGRSSPMAMPGSGRKHRTSSGDSDSSRQSSRYIETGSYEQSPSLLEHPQGWVGEVPVDATDEQLKEHLADAMHDVPEPRRVHPGVPGQSPPVFPRPSPPGTDHLLVFPTNTPDAWN